MKSCIYAGSFDPITLGHLDVIERAAALFDEVFVAIGNNSSKSGTFTVDERMSLIEKVVVHIPNVKVVSFTGLLADFSYELGCKVVIKGVRNFQDFDYERLLHDIGLTQQRGIETFIIFSKPELSHVSSSASKELCKYNGLTSGYVPLIVKQSLEKKLHNQFIIGVTGEAGMGKSHFVNKLVNLAAWKFNIKVHHVDLDVIGHDILSTLSEPVYITLRNSIRKKFRLMKSVLIDRKELGAIVFNDETARDELNEMMRIPMLTRIRREIDHHDGLIVLNGALLVEANFLSLCNNNVVVVSSTAEQQSKNLADRGLDNNQIVRRLLCQLSNQKKIKLINSSIKKERHGKVWEIKNVYDQAKFDTVVCEFIEQIQKDGLVGGMV
jgi:pantetheine-phosphate adenylyltransferase